MASFAEVLESVLEETAPTPAAVGGFERVLASFTDRVAEAAARFSTAPSEPEGVRDLVLGVDVPRTMAELRWAFRRMALQTHPDRPGGSHEAFLRTQALFEEASRVLAGERSRADAVSARPCGGAASWSAGRAADVPRPAHVASAYA